MSSVSTEDSGCQFGRMPVPIPGQKLGQLVDRMAFGHEVDDLGQIGLGIEPIELGGFQNSIENGRRLASGI
jgi:hypothetical protein